MTATIPTLDSSSAPRGESNGQDNPRLAEGAATPMIALVGNPNTGKSALFNRLTGARQRVGNYPGLTVEKKTGTVMLPPTAPCRSATMIDLPGIYSLHAMSLDEHVVIDALGGHVRGIPRPDLVVCVLEAANLRRNLFIVSQVGQLGIPVVVALNMIDEAEAAGLRIDTALLARRLGVPIVATDAAHGRGVEALKQAIAATLEAGPAFGQVQPIDWPGAVRAAAGQLQQAAAEATGRRVSEAEAYRAVFDADTLLPQRWGWRDAEAAGAAIVAARQILRDAKLDPAHVEATVRFAWIDALLQGVIHPPQAAAAAAKRFAWRQAIDAILIHRVAGLAFFMAVMYGVFISIYTFAGPAMDAIESLFFALGEWVGPPLESMPMLHSLVVDGLIAGVGGVVVFLPQILILFFFIALLEDTGYMARAAFLMDKLFSWCGLSGKSFVPLLSSYACAIPGVMATRTIEDPKARLTTILVAPLMSCSARLPVYVLMIGAFIEPVYGKVWAGTLLLVMHMLGLVVAAPVAFVFNRLILRGRNVPFVLELPPYRMPALRDVVWRMYERGREFVVRAGTVIFALSIIIWALCYFPRPAAVEQQVTANYTQELATQRGIDAAAAAQLLAAGNDEEATADLETHLSAAYLEQSYMGRAGRAVQPIFALAGFDWKITVGVLASFPAREVIISTLGIIYDLGADVDEESQTLRASMQHAQHADGRAVFNVPVALAVMVFFALCMQCGATVATIGREAGWWWSIFTFTYMTTLAWLGAVATFQVSSVWLA
jgi:ferrous iron transport protein B